MFYSRTKDLRAKIIFIWKSANIVLGGLLSIFSLFTFLNIGLHTLTLPGDSTLGNISINLYISIGLIAVNIIFFTFLRCKIRKSYVNELLEIVSTTVMPKKLPKVVYVYTTHNDFMPARLLQNCQQTYSNYEVWISDGSDKPQIINEIKTFATKHSIHLHQMHRSSISKSDNLNHFLKYSNAKFDYLLIADADESFDINTVQCNIRFFYSNRFERLAFVTPMNQCYKTSNIYTNVCRCLDNNTMFLRDSMKSVLHKDYSNLYSASSLISGNFLKYIGNKFPDTVLEDYYTENTAALHGWTGIISPLTVCTQQYDANIKTHFSRISRITESVLFLRKHNTFEKYNEKYEKWFNRSILLLFSPFLGFAGTLIISVLVWFVCIDAQVIFADWFFLTTVIVCGCTAVLLGIFAGFDYGKINGSSFLFFPFFMALYVFSLINYFLRSWWKVIVLKKQPVFNVTNKRLVKVKFWSAFNKIKWDLIVFIVLAGVLAAIDVPWITFLWNMSNLLLIFIILNTYLGIFVLSALATIILYLLSFIKFNKYDPSQFIHYKNAYVQSSKIKDAFYQAHPEYFRVC